MHAIYVTRKDRKQKATTTTTTPVSGCKPEIKPFPNFTGTVITTTFGLKAGLHLVIVNGLTQTPGEDYTYILNTITFPIQLEDANVIILKLCDGAGETIEKALSSMGKFANDETALAAMQANPALHQYLYRLTRVNDYNSKENTIIFIER
jgi:hypoxanthine phosphoribosyltransferase